MPSVREDLVALGQWLKPKSQGVTVYTGITAEHYPSAHRWKRDEKGTLDVLARSGRVLATFLDKTWLRVEAGSPPEYTPPPREELD